MFLTTHIIIWGVTPGIAACLITTCVALVSGMVWIDHSPLERVRGLAHRGGLGWQGRAFCYEHAAVFEALLGSCGCAEEAIATRKLWGGCRDKVCQGL